MTKGKVSHIIFANFSRTIFKNAFFYLKSFNENAFLQPLGIVSHFVRPTRSAA